MLLSLEPIRAVISSTHLILIVPNGADGFIEVLEKFLYEAFNLDFETVHDNIYNSEGNENEHGNVVKQEAGDSESGPVRKGVLLDEFRNMPYELRVYEAIISTVVAIEKENYRKLKEKANVIISKFKGAVSCITNHILLLYLFIYSEK